MPTSLLALAPRIVAGIWERFNELGRPITVLDIGPGFGRYGFLTRELVDGIERGTRIADLVAVEAEDRNVDAFPWLDTIYDDVIVDDATTLGAGFLERFDLVLMLDVIEHLEKPAALELLDRTPGAVIIATPRDYFDNPEADAGWPTERHRSHWTAGDFGDRVDRFDVDALETLAALLVRLAPQ